MDILQFKTQDEFKKWLKNNRDSQGQQVFIYKKKYHHKGLCYEDAVRAALCYGWIDSVKHSHDEEKFMLYFAKRKKGSNWSLSNIKRMKELIDNHEMTNAGLEYFDLDLIDQIEVLEAKEKREKSSDIVIPDYFLELLDDKNLSLFYGENKSQQRNFIKYIESAKKDETKIKRCHKVIGILNGEKNNL